MLKSAACESLAVQSDLSLSVPTHLIMLAAEPPYREQTRVQCYHEPVVAALDHGTAVDLVLDPEHIPAVSTEPITVLAENFELVSDGHYRGTLDEHDATVTELLAVNSWEEIVAIERLVLSQDGDPFLVYTPAEPLVAMDSDRVAGLAEDIATALADLPAGLTPAGEQVTWTHEGRQYRLAPPALIVDDERFDLAELAAIGLDREQRRIDLAWVANDRGLLARLFSSLGSSPPTRMTFETTSSYDRVARAFETLQESLGFCPGQSNPRW